jgi:hypothetical protein
LDSSSANVGLGDENLDVIHEEGTDEDMSSLPKLIVLEAKHRVTMRKGSAKAELFGQMRSIVQQGYTISTLALRILTCSGVGSCGILTDGMSWKVYHLQPEIFHLFVSREMKADTPQSRSELIGKFLERYYLNGPNG